MDAITYTKARENFAATMNKVCEDHSPLIITRQAQKPVVVMSLEDYNSLQETIYLMKSPANQSRLLKAIENVKAGKAIARTLME